MAAGDKYQQGRKLAVQCNRRVQPYTNGCGHTRPSLSPSPVPNYQISTCSFAPHPAAPRPQQAPSLEWEPSTRTQTRLGDTLILAGCKSRTTAGTRASAAESSINLLVPRGWRTRIESHAAAKSRWYAAPLCLNLGYLPSSIHKRTSTRQNPSLQTQANALARASGAS